jgi:hypothetical protein
MVTVSDLYEADILAWSERQAALLQWIARGERVNDAELDWPNIVEEIESVGRAQLHAVESLLVQALLYDLKAEAWPSSRDAPNWRAQARRFRGDATGRSAPSMRHCLDLAGIYRDALRALPDSMDGHQPLAVPDECAVTLDKLLAE